MKSCFGYIRVSTQRQGEGVSLEAQRDAILTFAERNDISISNWFEEVETAAKSGRPVFNEMLRLLRRGVVSGVVLHKPDRAARNFTDWAKIGDLSDSGIDVHFASESLDFRSRGGRLSADIQAVIAADYIRNLKDEIHKGQNGQLKDGLYPFKAPIGYLDMGGGKIKTIDSAKASKVKRLFELYASGAHSLRTLVPEAAMMGLVSTKRVAIAKSSLEVILGNPFYIGIIRIKKTGLIFKGAHEPLISADLFERVQEVRTEKGSKKVTKHGHAFQALFTCKSCGRSMTAERQKGAVYYRCHTHACETKSVREELLDDAVRGVLSHLEFDEESIVHLTTEMEGWLKARKENQSAKTHEMQLQQVDSRIDRLTDALIDHLIDAETFNVRKQALMVEKSKLLEAIEKLKNWGLNAEHIRNFFELMKSLVSNYIFAAVAEKRQIVDLMTSNRFVSGKSINVEPSNWVVATQNLLGVLYCGDDRATFRTDPEMRNEQLENLLVASCSYEAEQLEEICGKKKELALPKNRGWYKPKVEGSK